MRRAALLWLVLGALFVAGVAPAAASPTARTSRSGDSARPASPSQPDDAASPHPGESRAALISDLTSYLARVPFGTRWSQWRTDHERAECVPFRGSSWLKAPSEYWVFLCPEAGFGGELEFIFYLLDDDGEPTLERVNWTLDSTRVAAAKPASFRGDLRDTLVSRYTHMSVTGEPSWPGFSGQAFTTNSGVLGFDGSFDAPPRLDGRLQVQHVSRRLASAIADTAMSSLDSDEYVWARASYPEPGGSAVVDALRPHWPRVADALTAPSTRMADLRVLIEALRQVGQRPVPVQEHDLVVVAVHSWLAAHWAADSMAMDSILAREVSKTLGPSVTLGTTYQSDRCLDDSLLVGSLLERAGENPWADRVFLEFMHRGWENPCGLCGWGTWVGSDEFRPVIERGEAFLREHPRSPIRRDVALQVAQAHETAWSLSKADDSEGGEGVYIDARSYEPGAEAHRRRAIELYERIVNSASNAPADASLRRRLRRLKLDVDTNFHRYWCVWD